MTAGRRAVVVRTLGAPSVMEFASLPVPEPGTGQVRVSVHAIGVNFRDVQQRRKAHAATTLPFTPGSDFAGEIVAVGPDVSGLRPGTRVVGSLSEGAYAEQVIAPAAGVVELPDEVGYASAAMLPVAGLSASFLVSDTALRPGAVAVTYAPAGGLGGFLGGFLRAQGIRSIAITSSATKAEVALAAGHTDVVLYRETDPVAAVLDLTGGAGADVVFDSVAGPDFARSFRMARTGGTVVTIGKAAGDPDLGRLDEVFLGARRNLALRQFYLGASVRTRAVELPQRLRDLVDGAAAGRFAVPRTELPFEDVARAHELLESGTTVGKLVLLVGQN